MPRILVKTITPTLVSGTLTGVSQDAVLASSLGVIERSGESDFTLALPDDQRLDGTPVSIWLEEDPSVHVVLPLRLLGVAPHSLEDEVALLRSELELVKAMLRKLSGSQGQG